MSNSLDNAVHARADLTRLAFWAAFFSLSAAWMCIGLIVARMGLGVSWRALAAALAFVVLLAFSPFVPGLRARPGNSLPPAGLAIAMLLALAMPLAGFILGTHALWLQVAGATAGVVAAYPTLARLQRRDTAMLVAFPPCLTLFIIAQIDRGPIWFAHPWLPEHMLMGVQVLDTSYHAAIASMIASHGVVSTGLDGLARHYYHVGSHYWFAGFGRMAGTAAPLTYMFVQLAAVLPAMAMGFVYALLFARASAVARAGGWVALAVLAYLSIFVVKIYLFASESLALSLVLLSVGSLLVGQKLDQSAEPIRSANWRELAVVMVLTWALAAIKGPVALVWLAVLAFVGLRVGGPKRGPLAMLAAACAAFGLAMLAFYVPRSSGLVLGTAAALFRPSPDWSEVPEAAAILGMPMVAMLWALRSRVEQSREDCILAELIVLGSATALGICIFAYNGIYFVWAFAWISTSLVSGILAAKSLFIARNPAMALTRTPLRVMATALFALAALCIAAGPALQPVRVEFPGVRGATFTLSALDNAVGGGILGGRSPSAYFVDTMAREKRLFSAAFNQALSSLSGPQVIEAIRRSHPAKAAVVFVPSPNTDFWKMAPGQCQAPSFFIPAFTGIPMIFGLPPDVECRLEWYGFENYLASARSSYALEPDLCPRARAVGFERVIVLRLVGGRQQAAPRNCL